MASVTATIGPPTTESISQLRWFTLGVALLDASVFAQPITEARYLNRLQIWVNDAGNDERMQWRFSDEAGEGVSFQFSGDNLSPEWESYAQAITFSVDGIAADLVLPGPNHADNQSQDSTNVYDWRGPQGIQDWFADYLALTDDQQGTLALTLDDGEGAAVAVELTGADAGATTAAQIAVTVVAATNVDVELTGADAGATTTSQIVVTVVAATNVDVELTGADAGATTAGQIAVTVMAVTNVAVELTGADAGATTAGQIAVTVLAAPVPVARGYVGRISQSPVAEALTDAGRLALDRAIPDPDDALAVAYDWERMPIDVLRSQAAAWGFEPFTTLLGETYERQIMATFGQVCEYRNKWLVLDDFFAALQIIYAAEIVGLNGVRYGVDRTAGTWGGYDVTRARELWLLVTLPPAIPISNAEFIAYLAHAVRWLMPYFRHFVFLVFINQRIEGTPAAHPGVGVVAMSYLEAVQA